ncbi:MULTISPECIES: DNA topoisomerase IV subunit A [Enterococcus]|uniref:DNA topoisomerase 4 subunit A n=1 Tax=Enterococcus casseliflavus TaxID=37734 RepID=A0ABD6Z0U7_ENTCA|nr:DNA topoisomerase IV subunit A [Enterococcus casseliflavus]EOH79148.1 DNA topoisomerase IV, A subunit [Enterococcus casseliflavus ATCC 49996]EOU09046.1 DNA topoisomerase IV, A subunit [Enterococcus casseliflavus ATCC 49996]MBE9879236.1 DNA topoisomerase IV subunit A [Enterococcus casseliflavus]QGN30064.1 DNA topoisomerase IV subunit A [Enterococcus casseliflavus]QQB85459.1 DNA topoisomerase IV subunit A [Enterococcus casseliflavus]
MEHKSNIQELTLEEVMGDRFGRYSKYIIQERALPDIRDGLKPVQRRILFAMNQDGNTYDKGFRKSAKSVGNIMGNFHPHGDSSIYEAMVRMSQDWKLRQILIEMHGNNGSMDGDPPAAMRYTEARLSELSGELLKDIEKNTVELVWNFDDTEKEPTVLPAKYPNLLVNGSTGISAGYATEIPTHNLGEIIDGTIYLIDHPQASLDQLMKYIPGPDFPTGGILQGKEEIKKAYETGKGKVILRSKTKIEDIKGGKQQIVINEIPYEVNKANLVKKMDEIRLNKRIDGIAEVRDETDRTGLQIVVELKKEANAQGILNYLFKNTELQINYNFNMVAIDNMRPQQVGLKRILESYIKHRREVIEKRSRFELQKAQKRQHIVDGLIKALSILDEVIATIRGSKDKKDAKNNLVVQHGFTEEQAEAIVNLQLYRLTNTDITQLQAEAKELAETIAELTTILNEENELLKVIKKELREIKKKYTTPRLTEIEAEIQEIKIETQVLVAQEEVVVTVTRDGYVKRSSLRSYGASKPEEIGMKEGDSLLYSSQMNTLDHLLLVTNKGNTIYRPVHELPDLKWKDLGEHISQTVMTLTQDEMIIGVFAYKEIDPLKNFVLISKNGMIKQTRMTEFEPWRTYKTRPMTIMKLKDESDELINVFLTDQTEQMDVFLVSHLAFGLRYPLNEVPVVGPKAAGVKAMNLKADDYLINGLLVYSEGDTPIVLITQRGAAKRMLAQEINQLGRAKRGLMVLRELKKNPHRVVYMGSGENQQLLVTNQKGQSFEVITNQIPINDRTSNGSFIMDEKTGVQIYEVKTQISPAIAEDSVL